MTTRISRRQLLGGAAAGAAAGASGVVLRPSGAAAAARFSARVDVVIVGAGLAGIEAARKLHKAGVDYLILEARDRVGGRILNHSIGGGEIVEVGGQWVGPTQDEILALAKAVGVKTFLTYYEGENVGYQNGLRYTYDSALPIPPGDPVAFAEAAEIVQRLNDMASTIDPEKPWEAESAEGWDSQTMHSWMEDNVGHDGTKELIKLAVEGILACEPRDVSLLHVLFYIRSAGSLENLFLVTGGAQESRLVGGSQLIAIKAAAKLGRRIRLNSAVRRIVQNRREARVEGDRFSVVAKRVIVTLPPTLCGRIEYQPALPGYRDQLTQRVPMGTVIKTMCVYDKPFWRDEGLTGATISDTGPVKLTFDNSPPDGSPGVLLGFIEGEEARALSLQDKKTRREGVVSSLVRYFGDPASEPVSYIEKNWTAEPFSRGCYVGIFPPGAWLSWGAALRAPIGRIHWAGTETATKWMGYMDGAVRSGDRAAAEVLKKL